MRITKEMLLNIAEDTVAKRVKEDPTIMAAYLQGSILREEPLLGGTTDIDLVFIYAGGNRHREIARLTDEITLDIEYHPQNLYRPPRALRADPWLGYAVYDCQSVYDPGERARTCRAAAGRSAPDLAALPQPDSRIGA